MIILAFSSWFLILDYLPTCQHTSLPVYQHRYLLPYLPILPASLTFNLQTCQASYLASFLSAYLLTGLPSLRPENLNVFLPDLLTYLPAFIPTCLPAYLSTRFPALQPVCLPPYLPSCLSVTFLPASHYLQFVGTCSSTCPVSSGCVGGWVPGLIGNIDISAQL